jgi:hypothetical protein
MGRASKVQESLDYPFKYFDLHAKQRMTVFNFFLAIAGILTGGIAAGLGHDPPIPALSVALSIVLVLVAIVFQKLDNRTSFLIKHAERALKECEAELLNPCAQLISTEEEQFAAFQSEKGFWKSGWSYSDCFRTVYVAMVILGLVGLVLSAARFTAC